MHFRFETLNTTLLLTCITPQIAFRLNLIIDGFATIDVVFFFKHGYASYVF